MRERARERREEPRESEREQGGGCGVVRGIETRRGGQAGSRAGGVARWRARRAHSPPSVEDEDDRGGGGLGRPATAGLHREEPQVSFSFFIYFCFLISVICFDLNKILNHFITFKCFSLLNVFRKDDNS